MPQFTPKVVSDPSNLTHGRHPGYLLAITEEAIPEGWAMGAKDTLMFRWHLCIWEHADHMTQYAPEQQSGITSRAFSPKGKFQASKAWVWSCALLGREIPKGQGVDLDPLLPLACYVDIERTPGNDYCKVTALWGRPDGQGQAAIPPVVHQLRAQYATGFPQGQANGHTQPQTPAAQQAPPQAPAAPAQPYGTPPTYTPPSQAPPAAQPQWGQPGPATQPGWPGPQGQPQAQTTHPDMLCQLAQLPGHAAQQSGLCGEMAQTLMEGHRVCIFHVAHLNTRTAQPPQLPGTAPRGPGAAIPF